MAVIDEGGGRPTLNPKAKHFERQLFKVFSSSTSTIWLTQDDWKGAKTQLEDLAKDVDKVRAELQAPPDGGKGWTGPAAEAALASLAKLSATLDGHAAKVGDVDTSLGQVYTAITDAKSAWYSEVASISTHVDPSEHTRLPAPYLPTPQNTAQYSVPDTEAAAAAEDAKWEQRNQAAKRVLDQLGADTQTATATMPIESKTDTETPYSNRGPGGGGGDYPTGTQTASTSGGYQGQVRPVFTGGLVQVGDGTDTGDDVDLDPDKDDPTDTTIGEPELPTTDPDPDPDLDLDPDLDPISSDGDVTGTIGTNPAGGPTSAGVQAPGGGGGGLGAGGLAAGGLGAGAAGVGGILGARGGGFAGAGAPGGSRGGTTGRTGGAAGGRGGTAGAPGGARGGASMVPGGGTSGQSRAGASGRGSAVKGASGSGRYGVPKLDGRSNGMVPAGSHQAAKAGGGKAGARGPAGRGAAGGAGAAGRGGGVGAGGAGGARKGEASKATDVDKLTHEDEDTWYDGTDESSPQVWD